MHALNHSLSLPQTPRYTLILYNSNNINFGIPNVLKCKILKWGSHWADQTWRHSTHFEKSCKSESSLKLASKLRFVNLKSRQPNILLTFETKCVRKTVAYSTSQSRAHQCHRVIARTVFIFSNGSTSEWRTITSHTTGV